MLSHSTLIAAARLDPDARDAGLGQFRTQMSPATQRILHLPALGPTMNRNVQLVLGRIDARHRHANLRHLRRPCLVKRTRLFRQPSGSDEGADDDHATQQHKLLRVDSIRSPAALPRTAIRGRAFLSERADDSRFPYYKGGQRRFTRRAFDLPRHSLCPHGLHRRTYAWA